jgi:hypothetical protein
MSYLQKRLEDLKITQEANYFSAVNIDNVNQAFYYFTEDSNDNIVINYLTPSGQIEYYQKDNKFVPFTRTRFANPEDPKRKYTQAYKTTVVPFSTPLIIKAFQNKTKIKTLFITEGEFKAFSLDLHGLYCFGIGGTHNFKDNSKDKLHKYITDFIKVCEVENIVLLFDADCLKVEWKENEDLTKRLKTFYSAVDTFNELLKPYNVTFYFAHVDKESEHKGIDDLLAASKKTKDIINELNSLSVNSESRKFIRTYKISGISPYNIKRIFWLDKVETFFENNFKTLVDKEFVYDGDTYYNEGDGKLAVSWRGDQNNYIRIGVDYYKKVVETSPNKQTEVNLKRWNIGTIKADYNNSRMFLKKMPKCDSFTNIPENDPDKFQQIIYSEKGGIKSVLYNLYYPVSHIPQRGEWNNINTLLHHIFDYRNSSGESLYEFILDYLQIVYLSPTVKLPVLCLVSKENGTGKTTFLNFLRAIFIENMRILDSARISSQFNGSWAGKLIVAIDESLIKMETDTVKNRIKMIATNQTIPLEEKGMEAREIPNFAKLIMCSNDETNFMRIDQEENRYCIVKLNPIQKDKNDNKLFDKMVAEIPAFLHFLKNRQLYYPDKGRLYFDEAIYTTPALEKVKERTENPLIKNLKDVIKTQFIIAKDKDIIKLSLKVLTDLVAQQYKYADKIRIQEYLNDNNYKTKTSTNFEYFIPGTEEPIKLKDKVYEFDIKEFLNDQEIADLFDV